MAVARFASGKPLAGVDTLLHTIERTALTSVVAVNTSGFTKISARIVPAGESANPESWIHYINNIDLTSRNTFETFKIAVNTGDQIYVSSESGEVTFFINGIYDLAGTANITVGEQGPESPQIGDIWIDDSEDPIVVYFWSGSIWQEAGIIGPPNDLEIGLVEPGLPGENPEVTITGDSPNQILNFVIPPGPTGPATSIDVSSTTGLPGSEAEVSVTGPAGDQTVSFVIPQGPTGPGGSYQYSVTGPTAPTLINGETVGEGDVWFNTDTGRFYIYYDGYWVENTSSLAGPSGVVNVTSPITNTGTSTSANIGIDLSDYYTSSEVDIVSTQRAIAMSIVFR